MSVLRQRGILAVGDGDYLGAAVMRELARVDGALCVPREGKPDENVPLAYVDHLLVDLAGRNGADERHLVEYQPEIVVHEASKNAGAHSALNVDAAGVHDGVHGVDGLGVGVDVGAVLHDHQLIGDGDIDGLELPLGEEGPGLLLGCLLYTSDAADD